MTYNLNLFEAYSFPESADVSDFYINNYALNESGFTSAQMLLKNIFKNSFLKFPDFIIKNEYAFFIAMGGILMDEDDFASISRWMTHFNDKYLYVLEDYQESAPPHQSGPPLRFRFPAKLRWEEINQQDGIAYELFGRPIRNYYVFGDSSMWGKYIANDYVDESINPAGTPIELITFKANHCDYFSNELNCLHIDETWVPQCYKNSSQRLICK